MYLVYDAETLPSKPYPGAHGVASYLGGNTAGPPPTAEQWNLASGGGKLRCLGIWVAITNSHPVDQAIHAVNAAESLGWRANLGRYIALDREAIEDQEFVLAFAAAIDYRGFATIEYRSEDSILASPTPGDIPNWDAHWSVIPNFTEVPKLEIFQYESDVPFDGTFVDLNVADDKAFSRFGRGLRR